MDFWDFILHHILEKQERARSNMAGGNKSDQAMQRIFNKEGVTKVDTVTQKMTPLERLGLASKNCDSGPGHAEQKRPFYRGKLSVNR